MWIPTPQEITNIGFFGSALGALVGGYRKIQQFDKRASRVEKNTAQLIPNGGGHLADDVREIRTAIERLDNKNDAKFELVGSQLSNLDGRFEQHCREGETWRTSHETLHRKRRLLSVQTLLKSSDDSD